MLRLIIEIAVVILCVIFVLKIFIPLIKSMLPGKDSEPKTEKKSFDEEVHELKTEKEYLKERKEGLDKKIDEKVEKVNKLKD